jgi:hypothetical protein
LDTLGNLDRIRETLNLCPVEGISYEQASPRIAQVLTAQFLPAAKPPEFDTLTYTVSESHFKALLDAQEHFDLSLQELVDTNYIHERLAHLALQCLLYMSREEEEPPEELSGLLTCKA